VLTPPIENNYWATTVDSPAFAAAPQLPDSVDVAVVGAGFCGLSAARALAKRGVSVAVLEAQTFGWGASSRNGGMVLTGMKLPASTLIKRYGIEIVRKMYAASLETIDCVEQIVREEKIKCDFSRCGHLEVACKQRSPGASSTTSCASFRKASCAVKSARIFISVAWWTIPVRV
jgi:glycine/D-amino acid oxidase-like deaminating enzyme